MDFYPMLASINPWAAKPAQANIMEENILPTHSPKAIVSYISNTTVKNCNLIYCLLQPYFTLFPCILFNLLIDCLITIILSDYVPYFGTFHWKLHVVSSCIYEFLFSKLDLSSLYIVFYIFGIYLMYDNFTNLPFTTDSLLFLSFPLFLIAEREHSQNFRHFCIFPLFYFYWSFIHIIIASNILALVCFDNSSFFHVIMCPHLYTKRIFLGASHIIINTIDRFFHYEYLIRDNTALQEHLLNIRTFDVSNLRTAIRSDLYNYRTSEEFSPDYFDELEENAMMEYYDEVSDSDDEEDLYPFNHDNIMRTDNLTYRINYLYDMLHGCDINTCTHREHLYSRDNNYYVPPPDFRLLYNEVVNEMLDIWAAEEHEELLYLQYLEGYEDDHFTHYYYQDDSILYAESEWTSNPLPMPSHNISPTQFSLNIEEEEEEIPHNYWNSQFFANGVDKIPNINDFVKQVSAKVDFPINDMLVNFSLTYVSSVNHTTITDYISTFIIFIKLTYLDIIKYYGKRMKHRIIDLTKIYNQEFMEKMTLLFTPKYVEADGSSDLLKNLHTLLTSTKDFFLLPLEHISPLLAKIIKAIVMLVSGPLCNLYDLDADYFDLKGFSGFITTGVNKARLWSTRDFIALSLEIVILFIECGMNFFSGKGFVCNPTKIREFYEGYEKIVKIGQHLESDPSDSTNCNADHVLAFNEHIIDLGRKIVLKGEYSNNSIKDRPLINVQPMLAEIRIINKKIQAILRSRKTSIQPYSVILFGEPGCGKTLITNELITLLLIQRGFTHEQIDSLIFSVVNDDDFMSGFTSAVKALWFDDMNALRPTPGKPDKMMTLLLKLLNNVPVLLNMASLEDKGNIICAAILAMITLNDLQQWRHAICANYTVPRAIYRRINYYVNLVVLEKFQDPKDPGQVCSFLVSQYKKENPDLPYINIHRYLVYDDFPLANINSKPYKTFEDKQEFFDFIRTDFCEYIKAQEVYVDVTNNNMHSICKCGSILNVNTEHKCPLSLKVESENINFISHYRYTATYYLVYFQMLLTYYFLYMFATYPTIIPRTPMQRTVVADIACKVIEAQSAKLRTAFRDAQKYIAVVAFLVLFYRYRIRTAKDKDSTHHAEAIQYTQLAKDNKTNIWDTKNTGVDIRTVFKDSPGYSMDGISFFNSVKQNLVYISVLHDAVLDRWMTGIFLCVRENYYIGNYHYFENLTGDVHIVLSTSKDKTILCYRHSELLNMADVVADVRKDFVMFCVRGAPYKKDITSRFQVSVSENVDNVVGASDINTNYKSIIGVNHGIVPTRYESTSSDNVYMDDRYVINGIISKSGDCGTVYICDSNKRRAIIGIHCSGNKKDNAYAVPLSLDYITAIYKECKKLQPFVLHTEGAVCDTWIDSVKFTPLHKYNALFLLEPRHNIICYGTIGHIINRKSKFKYTLIREQLELAYDFKCEYFAPTFAPVIVDNVLVYPALDFLRKSCDLDIVFPNRIVDIAGNALKNDILHNLDIIDQYPNITKMTIMQAINGVGSINFMNRINMSTSSGFGLPGSKRSYAIPCEHEDYQDAVIFTPDVMNKIEQLDNAYATGTYQHTITSIAMKDAACKKIGKTRVFFVLPLPFLVLFRQYFLPIVRVMMNYPLQFEMAVGINCYSLEWDELARFLGNHSPNIVEADYKSFDVGQLAIFLLWALHILIEGNMRSGNFTEMDKVKMTQMALDTVFRLVNFDGTLLEFVRGLPSGHPLTVIINCLVNCMYLRIAFYLSGYDVSKFQELVKAATYGDDLVNSVSSSCPEYNQVTICKIMSHYGIIMTPADKGEFEHKYTTLDKATFLKRRFAYNSELDRFLAPLDFDSMLQSLCYRIENDNISDLQYVIEITESFITECVLHGQNHYDKAICVVNKMRTTLGLPLHTHTPYKDKLYDVCT